MVREPLSFRSDAKKEIVFKGKKMENSKIATIIRKGALLAALVAPFGGAQAADLPSMKDAPPPPPVIETGLPWFVRVGAAGVLFDSSASLTLGGAPIPGGSVKATNNVSALIEAGYYLNPNISFQVTGGYPPTTNLNGAGTVAPFGKLGQVTYGPAGVSLNYHVTNFGPFQPYVGGGLAYSVIFGQRDGAVNNLRVQGGAGWAVQGGFDYFVTRNWSVFVDAKKIFLSVTASGNALGFPVGAIVRLDPTIISGGLAYHW
jgi:outer membrane protein